MLNPNPNLYIDVHAIQSLPASNINADDLGAPKSVTYGGVSRARVSSQSWKRAIRRYFEDHMEEHDLGVRTTDMVAYLADKVRAKDDSIRSDDAMKSAEKVLDSVLGKSQLTKSKTAEDQHKVLKTMLFMSDQQGDALAQAIIDGKTKDKDYLKSLFKQDPSVDLALFGRMVASDPALNEDASVQYAHAVGTHANKPESDFFISSDDFDRENSGGAGMLGNLEFTSSTLYRYANIAGHHLLKQLNGDRDKTIRTMELFLKGFALTMPSGHVTSFGNQTLPSALVVTVRNDRPVSLVGGFEDPVTAHDGHGYVQKSKRRLADEYQSTNSFVNPPEFNLTIGMQDLLGDDQGDLNTLLDHFVEKIKPLLS